MVLFLDNAESILDPRGTNGQEIYAIVEELTEFDNICLCLTSRISTIPPSCEALDIPTLSMEAAHDTFYRVYKNGGQSDLISNILEQLDFHPLSITLLATVAQHNRWDASRLSGEWARRRTDVLRTQHNNSLTATIELSLTSPMFQALGPDARGLLEVVAFFPQGVDENGMDWLFPTPSDRMNIFDGFCTLSLTYRTNGFVTMLAPLRDHLCPRDPASSPLLHITKDCYFSRLSVDADSGNLGFEEARWIRTEDVNIEHLLDVFTSIDTNSVGVWDACAYFLSHLRWHKPRLVVLGPKIEGLPDNHPSKPKCLSRLSQLFESVGNYAEYKRLLVHALRLWRERGDANWVAATLTFISDANRLLGNREEGILQVKEALEILEQLGSVLQQADSWHRLALLLFDDKQFDAAEVAASRAISLLPDEGQPSRVCDCHRLLGNIYRSKGETEKAIEHFETALGIATPFNWRDHLFWNNHSLAELFYGENRFEDAQTYVERAKSYPIDSSYQMGRAVELQGTFWCGEGRFREAKSEVLRAIDIYEGVGATSDAGRCKVFLQNIEEKLKALDGEFLLEAMLLSTPSDAIAISLSSKDPSLTYCNRALFCISLTRFSLSFCASCHLAPRHACRDCFAFRVRCRPSVISRGSAV